MKGRATMFSTCNSSGWPVTAKIAWIAAATVVIASWLSGAISAEEWQATRRPVQVNQVHGGISRDPARAAIERLSEHEIKAFYARCSQEAADRKLDGGEAMSCSIGYDVLLNKHFSGNFNLLLAWSRAQQKRQGQGE